MAARSERLAGEDVQTVLISKSKSLADAEAILQDHGLKTKVDKGGKRAKFNRFRQRPKGAFERGSIRTVDTGIPGVKVTVGTRKRGNALDLMRPFG